MYAAYAGNSNLVKLLLKKGANVNAKDKSGRTALIDAAGYGRPGYITLWHEGSTGYSRNYPSKFYNELYNKLYIDSRRYECQDDIIKILLENGADVNAKANGSTALSCAEGHRCTEIIGLLKSIPLKIQRENKVKEMLKKNNFYCKDHDWTKGYNNPKGRGFTNKFDLQKNGRAVVDSASGLMWQQSGSHKCSCSNYFPLFCSDCFPGFST